MTGPQGRGLTPHVAPTMRPVPSRIAQRIPVLFPLMRFPKIIWLYTLADLWRIILLSTVVLVIVIAFASTVRHTAEGKLGPLETLRFMLYAMPPMLQYALPFAAGFGATLAFHRMTQDNEITAASASGVSHRSILFPALLTGIIIATGLSYLSGQVIPRFLRSMEQMITLDATKVLMGSIRAGRPVEFAGNVIHGRSVYQMTPPPEGATDQLVLSDLSALEIDPAGRVLTENFARRAWLTFYRAPVEAPDDPGEHSGRTLTVIAMDLEGPLRYKEGEGLISMGTTRLIHPIAGGMRDDPKFLTTRELAELPSHPDRYGDINQVRRGLALRVVENQWLKAVDQALRRDRRARLIDAENREFIIASAGLDRVDNTWKLLPPAPGRDVEVERIPAAQPGKPREPGTRFTAKLASISPEPDRADPLQDVRLVLKMKDVAGQTQDRPEVTPDAAGVSTEIAYGSLRLPDQPQREVLGLPSLKLLEDIRARGLSTDPIIGPGAADLSERISNLGRHVLSKQHERAANVAACLVMVLTGAVTALRLGSCLPLTVYLWSFFPAIVGLLTVSAGQQATRSFGFPGLLLLWGGVALLAAYAGGAFWLARKH